MKSRTPFKINEQQAHDLCAMRAHMYACVAKLADERGLTGGEVIAILKTISEDVYVAGIDQTFHTAPVKDKDNLADSFDFTWLTALAIGIEKHKSRGRKS